MISVDSQIEQAFKNSLKLSKSSGRAAFMLNDAPSKAKILKEQKHALDEEVAALRIHKATFQMKMDQMQLEIDMRDSALNQFRSVGFEITKSNNPEEVISSKKFLFDDSKMI